MFRSVTGLIVLLLASSLTLFAHEPARVEVFGGYPNIRANTGVDLQGVDHFGLNGWNASLNGYFNKYLGASADFGGGYGTPSVQGIGVSTKLYTFLFGPIVRVPNATHLTPFAHVLFGGAHVSGSVAGFSSSETDFAWAAGGGLDFDMSPRFGIRPAQVDLLQTRSGGPSQNNFRYSAGVIFKF